MNENLSIALNALNDKKAMDLAAIKVGDLTIVAEIFVLASATSTTHVRTLADEVEAKLTEIGVEPHHIEGKATGWILLDYGDMVVHVFSREAREFYNLDKMWSDGEIIDVTSYLKSDREEL